jgi:hypothetical protein
MEPVRDLILIRLDSRSGRGVLDTTLSDKSLSMTVMGQGFSPDNIVSSTHKSDYHEINKILVKDSQLKGYESFAIMRPPSSLHSCYLL